MLRRSWFARPCAKGGDDVLPKLVGFSFGNMAYGNRSSRSWHQRTVLAVTLALSCGLWSTELEAQAADSARTIPAGTDERSHTVKPGDTLWELAEQYLGDGLQWRTIAKRNGIEVTAATVVPIRVGQTLVIPSRTALPDQTIVSSAGELAVPQMALAPALRDTSPSAVLHIDQLLAERAKRRIGLVSGEEYASAKDRDETETVFRREVVTVESAERKAGVLIASTGAAPRRAEFDAAPFEITRDVLSVAGQVIRRIGASAEGRMLRADRVEISVGRGGKYRIGDRLVVVRIDGARGRSVAIPTGVLEVVNVTDGKAPVQAVVRTQTGTIEPGQYVVLSAGDPAARNVAVRLPTPDLETTVTWMDPSASMPTLQSFMLLGVGEPDGVRAGDEFALYDRAPGRQEQLIATVRVVRTVGSTSAALMTRQYASGIKPGVIARRYARTP